MPNLHIFRCIATHYLKCAMENIYLRFFPFERLDWIIDVWFRKLNDVLLKYTTMRHISRVCNPILHFICNANF